MTRNFYLFAVLFAALVFAAGCGDKPAAKMNSAELARQQALKSMDEQNEQISRIKVDMQKVREQQYELNRSLDDLQKKLDALPQSSEQVKRALEQMRGAESGLVTKGGKWSWVVLLLLGILIVSGCYWAYKQLTQDDESPDDGVIEETNLGTIHYPADQPSGEVSQSQDTQGPGVPEK